MARTNGNPHSASAQFYVTLTQPIHYLDKKCMVIGRVIQGMRAFRMIEKLETTNEKPDIDVKITGCGEFTVPK